MELYLLRHADAGDPETWRGNDADRPLSDKGRGQAERLGRLFADVSFRPDVFLTSPKVRALQTAQLAADPLKAKVDVDPRLAGPLDIVTVDRILVDAGDPQRPVLVGHDPELSELLGVLVGLGPLPMRKGAVAGVDIDRPLRPGGGTLRLLLPASMVPR
jgi:phosphohistidine phosphatase